MAINPRKSAVFFLAFGLFAFVMLSILGLGHMRGMTTNENGDMVGCIFTGQTMLCKMSFMEHISLWQSIFVATAQENLMLLALIILLVTVLLTAKKYIGPPRLSKNEALLQKLYFTQHPNLSLFDPLKEAFSQGILNPKIYEPARI